MTSPPKKSIALLACLLLFGCSNQPKTVSNATNKISKSAHSWHDNPKASPLIQQYEKWAGTPYKYGGESKSGVDCSAFVQSVYLEARNKALPRTTKAQSQLGYRVNINEIKSGDLLFFKTSAKDRHVGIYLSDRAFMHASTSKGVIISRLDNPYWASVFWQARRIN